MQSIEGMINMWFFVIGFFFGGLTVGISIMWFLKDDKKRGVKNNTRKNAEKK